MSDKPLITPRNIGRANRLIWAIGFSGLAGALFVGGLLLLGKAKRNPWVDVPFQGHLANGIVTGHYVWQGEQWTLSWANSKVPQTVQINQDDPTDVRLGQLTKQKSLSTAHSMMALAIIMLVIVWMVTWIVWKRQFLITIN